VVRERGGTYRFPAGFPPPAATETGSEHRDTHDSQPFPARAEQSPPSAADHIEKLATAVSLLDRGLISGAAFAEFRHELRTHGSAESEQVESRDHLNSKDASASGNCATRFGITTVSSATNPGVAI
jgi:hypothetical protein